MIKFFVEAFLIYCVIKLCLWLRLFSWLDLREFGLFCAVLVVLFIVGRITHRLTESRS